MRARGQRRANHRAEIMRVFDAVEKHDEPLAAMIGAFICRGENAFERGRCPRGGQRDDTLMIFGVGKPIELSAVFKSDRNVAPACELDDLLDACVLAAARDHNPIEWAARFERFANGVNAGELVHRSNSLQHVGARYIVRLRRKPEADQSSAAQNSTMRWRADFTETANERFAASSRSKMMRSSSPSPTRPAMASRMG